jgi:hypothetical protein
MLRNLLAQATSSPEYAEWPAVVPECRPFGYVAVAGVSAGTNLIAGTVKV